MGDALILIAGLLVLGRTGVVIDEANGTVHGTDLQDVPPEH